MWMMRGVGKQESTTRTVSFVGDFKTDKDARRVLKCCS
jgi:GTP cyclohydrolase I